MYKITMKWYSIAHSFPFKIMQCYTSFSNWVFINMKRKKFITTNLKVHCNWVDTNPI